MRVRLSSRAHLRLWMLLFAAFVIVGGVATVTIFRLSLDQYSNDVKSELVATARLMAISIDGEQHEKLQKTEDMEGSVYRKLVGTLARCQRQAQDIHYVYTLRRIPDGSYVFVLDPTTPGDHDGDGQDDKSYLLDPYPEVTSWAKQVYETGIATAEPTLYSDRWGTFWSAYAPIVDSQGKTVAVLGVDRDASQIQEHLAAMYQAAYFSGAMILGLGALFAYMLVRLLQRRDNKSGALAAATHSRAIRTTLLEIILAGLAFSVLIVGLNSYSSYSNLQERVTATQLLGESLDELTQRVQRLGFGATLDKDSLDQIARSVENSNRGILLGLIQDVRQARADEWRPIVARMAAQLALEQDRLRAQKASLRQQLQTHIGTLNVAFLIAVGLGLSALFVLRIAAKQQHDLMAAQEESERHQSAYEQIAENLPIGLYMIRDGVIVFSNDAFDHQLLRHKDEDVMDAFFRALHPEDRDGLIHSLMAASNSMSPLELQFRLVSPGGKILTMESRAVPVLNSDQELDHLLGFVIDITGRLEAQRSLQAKTDELQAKNVMLEHALRELEENFEAMVQGLVKAVEAKDPYTAGHSERVMQYSMAIGHEMGLSPNDLKILQTGTLVHDIGKIGIPDKILLKPGRLSNEEFATIRLHPVIGAEMVKNIPAFRDCLPIIRWHHERLDGAGYPDKLKGEEIPLLVRITTAADIFDAMTSSRAYRAALDPVKVLEELWSLVDRGALDSEVVSVLADIVERDGILWSQSQEKAA